MTDRIATLIAGEIYPAEPKQTLTKRDAFRTASGSLENVGKCLQLWTVQEQEEAGLFLVAKDPVPVGKVANSWARVERNGRPVDVPDLVDYIVPGENINEEMYRRLELDLSYLGHAFQMNETSRNLIRRAAVQASMFLLSGGVPTDAKWHLPADQKDSGTNFAWIATDNTRVSMLASEVIDFGNAVDEREMFLRMKARELKDTNPIPLDYEDDKYWS